MCQPDPDQQPRLFVDPGEDRRGYVYLLIAHKAGRPDALLVARRPP